MKKALITGITGQDGSYLTELLLGKVRGNNLREKVAEYCAEFIRPDYEKQDAGTPAEPDVSEK